MPPADNQQGKSPPRDSLSTYYNVCSKILIRTGPWFLTFNKVNMKYAFIVRETNMETDTCVYACGPGLCALHKAR